MKRATIICETDLPEQVRLADDWLERSRARLTFVSDDEGCGCCVHVYRVEGPDEVIDSLPEAVRGISDWNGRGNKSRGRRV